MTAFLIRRIGGTIPTLFLITVFVFLLIRAMPGDPAVAVCGDDATEEQLEAVREVFRLNDPLHTQYLAWLKQILSGHLGRSLQSNYPIASLFVQRIPVTLLITGGGMLLGLIIACGIGVAAVTSKSSAIRSACTLYLSVIYATPSFWLCILLILVFSEALHLLPPSGYPFRAPLASRLLYLLLPWIGLGMKQSSVIGRYVQACLAEELARPYTVTARGKGITEARVVIYHAFRNTLIPVVTVIGMQIGFFMAGAIIIETVFNLPGVGRLMLYAFSIRDYPVLQATLLFVGLAVVVSNLAVDLLYAVIDPRVQYT